uniref:UPF0378 protein KIAA0100 n=2 Tax=Schistocephalus solidus TaxID=70667 RepID=A0A0X3PLK8_SCHSO
MNSLLSQSIAYYQQLRVQSQRKRLQFAMTVHEETTNRGLHSPVSSPSRADCSSDTPSAAASLQDAAGSVQPPAEIVRRDEVCFEHAHWRMTENDGQIGLADVELRGYIYARTHRRDDSGSHWCELGWVRVSSLAPNSFYKEVLVPDTSSDHYTGGPVLRIYCTQRPPVGAIAVCEVMEISIAPFVLQVSKHFYNLMMPFFFPDRAPDANTTTGDRTTEDGASGVLPVVPSKVDITPVPNDSALSRAERLPDAADADSSRSFNTTRREKSKKNLPRILPSPISDISHSAYGTGSRFSRFRNRKDRLDVPVSAASPENPPPTGIEIGQADLTVDDVLSNHGEGLGVELVIPQDSSGTAATSLAPSHASFTDKLSRPLSDKAGSVASSSTAADRPRGQFPAPSSAAQEVFASASTVGFGGQSVKAASTAIAPLDAVEVMRKRARSNRSFLYIKIPSFPIRLSYKGDKQKNLADCTRFELNVPMLEFQNQLWTWLDFFNAVKTRVRRQLIKEAIKKKLTPRPRLPFLANSLSGGTSKPNKGAKGSASHSHASYQFSPTHRFSAITASGQPPTLSEEAKRAQQVQEMLLGRHAQQEQPRPRWQFGGVFKKT